jgi:5-epi-alpha-selinene synthase
MQAGQTAEDRARFMKCLTTFINAVREGHVQTQIGTVEYIQRRLNSVGTNAMLATHTWCYNLSIPPCIFDHKAAKCIFREVGMAVMLVNDLGSLKKEIDDGEVHNIITVMLYNEDITVQEAADRVVGMLEQSYKDFLEAAQLLRDTISGEHAQLRADVDTLVDACKDMMVGNMMWTLHAPRYISREAFNGNGLGFTVIL